jgi:hypothetical protein
VAQIVSSKFSNNPLVRRALWTALYAGFGALAALVSRRAASKVWILATGEEPPAKK